MTTNPTVAPPALERNTVRVAFQGELGAYSHEAIAQHWHEAAMAIPSLSFDQVLANVESGLADRGIIPIWNTIVGEVTPGLAAVGANLSATHGLIVTDTVSLVVRHQLLGLPGSTLRELSSVTSHPVALAQCGRFLATHPKMIPNPAYDTAGAAHDLALNGTLSSATIAGSLAAERYGLVILAHDIQDVRHNVTRFLVVARARDESRGSPRIESDGSIRW
ncbi:MAG: prephenate dehydratase domain-containing protein [Gemmatimonadaceae bacterium]